MTRPPIAVLGAATGPRAEAFRAALAGLGMPPATLFSYADFLADPDGFEAALRPGTVLRFDSPDREHASLVALYRLGAVAASDAGYDVLDGSVLEARLREPGVIGSPAQLALGLELALNKAVALAARRGVRLTSTPAEIARSFDKTACAADLEERGIAVPRQIGPVTGFDDLIERMRAERLTRVFVKLRFGSSAAGMAALALGPRGEMACYTTATLGGDGVPRSTRGLRRLATQREVRVVIDALAPLGLHAEAWLAKAGIEGGNADLRLVAVNGEPVFNVMRISPHPMTNLHLGGTRRPPDELRTRVGDRGWAALIESCRAAAGAFPSCTMLGIDAAILAGDRRHAVFEVNAFGDHVKGVRYRGCSPQQWQILSYAHREAA